MHQQASGWARRWKQAGIWLVLLCLWAPLAQAAVTLRVTYQTHAAFLAQGNQGPGMLLVRRSNSDGDQNGALGVAWPEFNGNVSNQLVSINQPAGWYSVGYNNKAAMQAQGCSTSPIDFNTFRYLNDGDTLDVTITCTMPPMPPKVTDGAISLSGATGTGGAYKNSDWVFVEWDNTASGDNNSGVTAVTVDFSQFGGGAAVAATNTGDKWKAQILLNGAAIDAGNRNVSVTATNAHGTTTTVDTSNVQVDTIRPVMTPANVVISGASGVDWPSATPAFIAGDTAVVRWNAAADAASNSDITSVNVDFSQFGGPAAVAATFSGGVWEASYTLPAGSVFASNRNVVLKATDDVGNPGSVNALKNHLVDTTLPSVTSSAPLGAPASTAIAVDFEVRFNSVVRDRNSPGPTDGIATTHFALTATGSAAGTISGVTRTSLGVYKVTVSGISGNGTLRVDVGNDVTDAAGNPVPAYSGGTTHTVAIPTAPDAPTIGVATAGDGQASVAFTAPASNGGSAITGYTVTSFPGGATGTGTASPITVTGLSNGTAYTFTVTATNAIGTSSASTASGSATPKANQTISFAQPMNQDFGTTPTLTATATSSLPVTFSSATTGVCTITAGGALTFVTAGSCTIDADQAGNGATNAAPTVSRTFTVNAVVPDAPTIGSATAGDAQADVSFIAPASNGGATITGYTVTSSPLGATGAGAGSPITVTGLSNGTAYTFTVTATNSAGTGGASGASNSITPASPQVISFADPGTQSFGMSPTLSASATSSLPVTFTSSTTGVCTITSGGQLSFIAAGTCTIHANQAGNGSYLAAPQETRSFTVSPVVPDAPTIGTATAGDTQASVVFTAPVNTGGTTLTGYTVTVSPADVAPVNGAASPIVVTGLTNGQAYTFTVTAGNAAGTGPASGASNSVTPKAAQVISFANPGAQTFGTSPTLSASSDSGLTPSFTSSTPAVCTITSGGALTFIAAGTCTINADQGGNGSYLAAPQVTQNFAVNAALPGAPSIGTATVTGAGQVSVAFTAPANTGGAAITGYTVTPNPAVAGGPFTGMASPITVGGLDTGTSYTFTVTATNSVGTGPASAASNAVTTAVTQVITFANPGAQAFDAPLALTASVDSGLPLRFAASTPAVCAVTSAGVLSFISAGTCTVTVHQDGDASHQAASLTQSFTVNAVAPTVPVPGEATVVGSGEVAVHFTPSAATGETITYTVTAQPGGITASGTTSPIIVRGLTDGVAYTFTVSASGQQAGSSAPSAPTAPAVPQVLQTVIFDAVATQRFDQLPALSARASSGLPVTFSSSTQGVCTVTPEGQLAFVQAGSCTLMAEQVGNATHHPASATRSFRIDPVPPGEPVIQTLTPVAPGQVNVAFDPPTYTGGAAIDGYRVTATPQASAASGIRAMRVGAASTPGVVTATGSGSPILVQGLAEGVTYVFTVAAYNLAGEGDPDSATELVAAPDLRWVGDLQKVYGEGDFELPLPQSNSPGAFTFTSSNPAVATVNGRTVTLVGDGSTTLTATQAATSHYLTGTVTLTLVVSPRPDPTLDAQVRGGIQAQLDASARFAQIQSGNIRDRMRQVRSGSVDNAFQFALAYAGARGAPGLSVPADAAKALMPRLPEGWSLWVAGTASFGRAGRNGFAGGGFDFNAGGVTLGVDHALGDALLLGMAGSWGKQDTDFDGSPSKVDADQRSLAVYGLWRISKDLFVDGVLANGQLEFDTVRWNGLAQASARGQRTGDQWFGSLTFGHERHIATGMNLTSYGRYDWHRADLDGYRESGLGAFDLMYGKQRMRNSSLALGVEGSFLFKRSWGSLRPHWTLEYRGALENRGDVTVNYVQRPASGDYVLGLRSDGDDAVAAKAGMDLQLDSGWMFSLLLGHEQGRDARRSTSVGLQLRFGQQSAVPMQGDAAVSSDPLHRCQPSDLQCRERAREQP